MREARTIWIGRALLAASVWLSACTASPSEPENETRAENDERMEDEPKPSKPDAATPKGDAGPQGRTPAKEGGAQGRGRVAS